MTMVNIPVTPDIPEQIMGTNIIPIRSGEKVPAVSWKKYQSELYPRSKLESWEGNFAMICGRVSSGLVVVDIDSPILYERFFSDQETFTIRTPSGGYHLYYRTDRSEKIPHYNGYPVDIQGEGSYVLTPPSVVNNTQYKVIKSLEITEIGWDSLVELLDSKLKRLERPQDIEDFKKQLDLSVVIQNYVSCAEKCKGYWQGLCPFHSEKHPSFTVYDDHYYCFGCGSNGDVISFIQ